MHYKREWVYIKVFIQLIMLLTNLIIKEENIDKEKRRYALPRTNPMGRDRFQNKYYYFDEVGLVVNERYGTGRILVQSPSSREIVDVLTEAGRQKYNKRRKLEESFGSEEAQWGYYEDPEQVCNFPVKNITSFK